MSLPISGIPKPFAPWARPTAATQSPSSCPVTASWPPASWGAMVAGPIRGMMAKFVRYATPGAHVLSYQEIPDSKQVTIVATVGQQ